MNERPGKVESELAQSIQISPTGRPGGGRPALFRVKGERSPRSRHFFDAACLRDHRETETHRADSLHSETGPRLVARLKNLGLQVPLDLERLAIRRGFV